MKSEDPYSADYDMGETKSPRLDGVQIEEAWWLEPRDASPQEIKNLTNQIKPREEDERNTPTADG